MKKRAEKNKPTANLPSAKPIGGINTALLHCPIRGDLTASALAKDGLTPTEEARRIEFIKYLLDRGYPADHISVETVVLKGLGEKGRNKLRCDVVVYDLTVSEIHTLPFEKRLAHATLVAEIKRDSSKKTSALTCQLEPAMRQLPGMEVMGVYWDDIDRLLFTKRLTDDGGKQSVDVLQDSLANLPPFGKLYKQKAITLPTLTAPDNLVGVLFSIANIMRSHGVNDEHLRYKETVKIILARYCDEKAAAERSDKELGLQVHPGADPLFNKRVQEIYKVAATRYARAKSLFQPVPQSELTDRVLRSIVREIQGINFSNASNETMQQVFMSFVPTVFKKSLDQYFTPITLVETMVAMTHIGPNDKIADPAMGTGDFLTAAMEYRAERGDKDIMQRVFGIDTDPKAFDLAVVNMILNRDGQANLVNADSIEEVGRWNKEMGVVLCNPPFGARSLERRSTVLAKYDLGHMWERDLRTGRWEKTDKILDAQQLGLLFLERSVKMLVNRGRLAIILPEGYLSTPTYGYVRQWIVDNLRVLSLTELPRRIFTKSDADLRSNILVAQKLTKQELKTCIKDDYPIHAELVRKVGFKMGTGFQPMPVRDEATGLEIRDDKNRIVLDSDFTRVAAGFEKFTEITKWDKASPYAIPDTAWTGARVSDILSHPNLDMKPRRLVPRALANKRALLAGNYVKLGDIVESVSDTIDLLAPSRESAYFRLVEGLDIRAVEGTVLPQHPARGWRIADRKSRNVYTLRSGDIIVGLVRPERRNIGLFLDEGSDVVGSPDGIAVLRVRPEYAKKYPLEWVFATLRSEPCRLQLWTESGGTSYGKLTDHHLTTLLLPVPDSAQIEGTRRRVSAWAKSIMDAQKEWSALGTEEDRVPIRNSAIVGLEAEDD